MDDYAKIAVQISLENKAYLEKLIQSQDATKKFSDSVGQGLGAFNNLAKRAFGGLEFLGAAGAVTAIGMQLYDCAKAAMEAEEKQVRLNAALISTHYLSGQTKESINEYSESLSRMSTYSKEAIIGLSTDLLKFTNIRGQIFKEAVQVSLDISARSGRDLAEVGQQMGRSLENPANAQKLLKQVGAELSTEQQDLVNKMLAANNVAGAQAIVMKNLATFQGAAAAETETAAGKWKMLHNQLEELKEEIGAGMIPGLTDAAKYLIKTSDGAHSTAKNFGELIGVLAKGGSYLAEGFKSQWNTSLVGVTNNLAIALMSGHGLDSFKEVGTSFGNSFGLCFITGAKEKLETINAFDLMKKTISGEINPILEAQKAQQEKYRISGIEKYAGKIEQEKLQWDQYLAKNKQNYSAQIAVENDHYEKMKKIWSDLYAGKANANQKLADLDQQHTLNEKQILADQVKDTVDNINKGLSAWQGSLSQMAGIFNQIADSQQSYLQRQQEKYDNLFSAMQSAAETAAGVQGATQEQQNAKQIASLQKQIRDETNIKKRRDLQEQLRERQHNQKQIQIEKEFQTMRFIFDEIERMKRNVIAKKNFETQKAFTIAQLGVKMAESIGLAIAAAWATAGAAWPVGVALSAASLAINAAMYGVEIGLASAQNFTPIYHTGEWDVPETGPAIVERHEMILPAPIAERIREAPAESTAPTVHMDFRGAHIYDKVGVLKVIKDVMQSNNIKLKTAGAY